MIEWIQSHDTSHYKSILKATNKSHVLIWHDWHAHLRWFVGKSQREMDDQWETPMTKRKPPAVYCMTVVGLTLVWHVLHNKNMCLYLSMIFQKSEKQ